MIAGSGFRARAAWFVSAVAFVLWSAAWLAVLGWRNPVAALCLGAVFATSFAYAGVVTQMSPVLTTRQQVGWLVAVILNLYELQAVLSRTAASLGVIVFAPAALFIVAAIMRPRTSQRSVSA